MNKNVTKGVLYDYCPALPMRFSFLPDTDGKEMIEVFNIAICDDEDILINELKYNLKKYADETGREFFFFVYHDGSELLAAYRPDYDLIFMDIKMENLNGLKTAEKIRKMDSTVGLIFLTSLKQYT